MGQRRKKGVDRGGRRGRAEEKRVLTISKQCLEESHLEEMEIGLVIGGARSAVKGLRKQHKPRPGCGQADLD